MDLRVDSPKISSDFQLMCEGAPLPWRRGAGRHRWSVVDAEGAEVCCFDGSAPETPMLMAAIVVAVNTCAGFRAEPST